MEVKIKFNTDNDAFSGDPRGEISSILQKIAIQIYLRRSNEGFILDANGNNIGKWSWE